MMKRAIVISLAGVLSLGAAPISRTGTWSLGGDGPEKAGGRLLTRHEGEAVHFQLECWRGAPSYNSGFIAGRMTLVGRKGTFRSEEGGSLCELEFLFSGDKVVITSGDSSDCGFGYAVHADGTYRRTSRKPPEFSDGDPRDK